MASLHLVGWVVLFLVGIRLCTLSAAEPFQRPFSVYLNPVDSIPEEDEDAFNRPRNVPRTTDEPEVETIFPDGCSSSVVDTCKDQLLSCIPQVATSHEDVCKVGLN